MLQRQRRFPLSSAALLRLYRAGVVATALLLLYFQARWLEVEKAVPITLRQALRFFPGANRIQLRDADRGLYLVTNARGDSLGALLRTSPQTDKIIGYSGPNDVLIALDNRGQIAGLELLRSGDTPEHVERVKRAPHFLRGFQGWRPSDGQAPKVEGVSGATLTSSAVAEAVIERLAGAAPSLRFPEPISLPEIQTLFTNAARFQLEKARWIVQDRAGQPLGFVLRTSPQADNVAGYRGPTECLVGLQLDGKTVTGVRLLRSYDTDSYVDQVRRTEAFLRKFAGIRVNELAAREWTVTRVDGVSGATQTARAVTEGIKRRLEAECKQAGTVVAWRPGWKDWALAAVLAGAISMAFTELRGRRWARIGWQLILVGYVGALEHQFVSLALLGGWAAHGPALHAAPGLVLLVLASFLAPWGTRRQLYCHQVCPHGAAQQLLGGASSAVQGWWRRRSGLQARSPVSRWAGPVLKRMEHLPVLLLAAAFMSLLLDLKINLVSLEPFDAWSWRTAGTATLVIALAGFAGALFVPQAYCRFGCPTGALLRFVRTSGSGERWGRRDSAAATLLLLGAIAMGTARFWPHFAPEVPPLEFTGQTMGTNWLVKIRDEVADQAAIKKAITREFVWAESLTAHGRPNSDLAEFNGSRTTNWFPVPWPVVTLSRWAREISRATGGAFDITAGPLNRLWSFDSTPPRRAAPADAEIRVALESGGWEKLEVQDGQLRKKHLELEIDLSNIAKGWAIDQVAQLLARRGDSNVLIGAGDAWRASGRWKVPLDSSTGALVLANESMATSRSARGVVPDTIGGRPALLDPRTGRPVTHRTTSVRVRHDDCAHAQAWAAALQVLGAQDGLALAERLGLAAQFSGARADGALEVRQTSAWMNRSRSAEAPQPRR